MRNIKNDKANLEKKRSLFFQIGLIIAFSILLFAFEWGSEISKTGSGYQIAGIDLETEMTPITRRKELKPPLPKQYKEFKIVEDKEEVKKPIEIIDISIGPEDPTWYLTQIIEVEQEDEPEEKIWTITEEAPEPPGGIKGLQHFLAKNTKYPNIAIENDMQGKVYVRFVINEKGEVENAHVIRPVYPILDKEALRVVRTLPNWKPGKQGGKPVKVWFTVPIVFVLN
ncbi:MAG: energy transducer TonB [Bacteroidota bacterium]